MLKKLLAWGKEILIGGGVIAAIIIAIIGTPLKEFFGNEPPSAILNVYPYEGEAPLEVTLLGTSSKDPEGKKLRYLWQINGDTISYSNVGELKHLFKQAGLYHIVLTVFDKKGLSDSQNSRINVTEKIFLRNIETFYKGYFHFSKDSSRFSLLTIKQLQPPEPDNNIQFSFHTLIDTTVRGAYGKGFYDQSTKRIIFAPHNICKVFRNTYGKIIIQSIDQDRFPFVDFQEK